MTDLVPATNTDVVVSPGTGELVDLRDPAAVARALRDLRAHDQQIRTAKSILTDALAAEAERQGSKTLHLEGVGKVEMQGGPGSSLHWDIDMLDLLREEGLPEERWNQLVTMEVSYKINASVAKSIAGANARYAEIISAAQTRSDRNWSARIT